MYFPPAYNQEPMFSCTANAAAAVMEYYFLVIRQLTYDNAVKLGQYRGLSRLFIYYNARKLTDDWMFDNGATIRATLGALKLFGVPYENFWPYALENRYIEPTPFVFALANVNRLDSYILHEDDDRKKIITDVQRYLAAGIPSVFGFKMHESYDKNFNRQPTDKNPDDGNKVIGAFPFPEENENQVYGHSVVAVGYDDDARIIHPKSGRETRGAFKIRNSWGRSWGEEGYGWLPYEYVIRDLAYNFWSLLLMKYINVDNFGIILDEATPPVHPRRP